MSFIPRINFSYELQDTIHTLREENANLHHRLKNLTQTLRELRKLLLDHSHGLSAETHLMLEQAFCLPHLHASANLYFPQEILLVLSGLIWIWILLM
ncbi:hypothetical protein PO909_025519 [Leuciscus waleckii]